MILSPPRQVERGGAYCKQKTIDQGYMTFVYCLVNKEALVSVTMEGYWQH